MSVYFITDGRRRVKIGLSENPQARLAALQTGSADELGIILTMPGDGDEEAFLHEMFKKDRIIGEWFAISDALFDFMVFAQQERHWGVPRETFREWVDLQQADLRYGAVLHDEIGWAHSVQAA